MFTIRSTTVEVLDPGVLFGRLLDDGAAAIRVRTSSGATSELPVGRWLAPACPVDERLLDRATGPVLDVGCGPGRHVHALSRRGVLAVGVERCPVASRHARAGGATVLQASIFDLDPSPGRWATILLLDGNVGIGGDPVLLLRRLRGMLRAGGRILVELEADATDAIDAADAADGTWGPPAGPDRWPGGGGSAVRMECGDEVSAWFPWAWVGGAAIDGVARSAGLQVDEAWSDDGRVFCALVVS